MANSTNGSVKNPEVVIEKTTRQRLRQTDVPGCSLNEALRIPKAIADNYASRPTSPLNVAKALEMQPNSGSFRMLCGAALAYGLTDGGPNVTEISITPIGLKIVRPLSEDDDIRALRQALLEPRVVGEFLNKYDNAPLPREDIALNVLDDMGVPQNRTKDVLDLIVDGAESVGYVTEIRGKRYIDLSSEASTPKDFPEELESEDVRADEPDPKESKSSSGVQSPQLTTNEEFTTRKRRVFVTHGKDKSFIEPIKKLLAFGELEPVVSEERQSVSQPVPDKVLNDMRSCGAAIIHVGDEQRLFDKEANEHIVLNENVLMEIGSATALYGRRFILLVKNGITLPSNLQGLYEVRYTGEKLDGEATIKLLEAINDIKNHPLPVH